MATLFAGSCTSSAKVPSHGLSIEACITNREMNEVDEALLDDAYDRGQTLAAPMASSSRPEATVL
eukprot:scaffold1954_cov268-Pinguiococcus_pyrenoidosus.AAC.296